MEIFEKNLWSVPRVHLEFEKNLWSVPRVHLEFEKNLWSVPQNYFEYKKKSLESSAKVFISKILLYYDIFIVKIITVKP